MSILFDEWAVGSMRSRNRFVRAATYDGLATDEGLPTPPMVERYARLAAGGVGTIITGYASVTADEQPNPHMLGIYDDRFVEGYGTLLDAAHAEGAKLVLQVVYGGSASRMKPPSRRILGPSAVVNPSTGIVPVEASKEDIDMLVSAFAAAAARAQAAGFDGVEVHAAHGYLFSQFMSPLFNKRTDAYGGSAENRVRIVAEAVAAMRRSTASDFPLLVKLNSSDGVEGGLVEQDSLAMAKRLVAAGASALEVSGAWRTFDVRAQAGPFFADYAEQLACEVAVPVVLTGGNRSFGVMERLAKRGRVAAFGLCRPLICQPDLVNLWHVQPDAMPRCASCNGCSSTEGHVCVREQEHATRFRHARPTR